MNYVNFKKLLGTGLVLTGLVFSTQAFADGCVDTGDNDTFVTPYGGATLACPSSAYTECIVTFKNGNVTSETMGCTDLSLSADIDPVTGGITWESNSLNPEDWIDAALTDSAQGGKGCLYSFGTDKNMGDKLGYATNSTEPFDFFPPTKAVFCSDGVAETTAVFEPTPEVKNCILEVDENGNSVPKVIHGVDFSCQGVGFGETRTIIVIKDTQNCDVNGENCEEVPAFGFTDLAGNIDFNNVCRCVGNDDNSGVLPTISACEPDPEFPGGCEVIEAEVPVDISIQNPKCFTVGGKRRCY